jgi:hypothetical protein
MAKEPKTGSGNRNLRIAFCALFLILFVVEAFMAITKAVEERYKMEDPLPKLIENIYCPMAGSSDKVIFYIVDANDQSGSVKLKSGDPRETLNILIPATESKDQIKAVKESITVKSVKFTRTSGRDLSALPPSDDVIRQKADEGEVMTDNNFVIDKENISVKKDNNNNFSNVQVPLQWIIRQTGYYRVEIETNLNRVKFETNPQKRIILDNTIIIPASGDKLDEGAIKNKWNNYTTTIYIAVYDGTKPKQDTEERRPDFYRVH